jgi:hypothetical protein
MVTNIFETVFHCSWQLFIKCCSSGYLYHVAVECSNISVEHWNVEPVQGAKTQMKTITKFWRSSILKVEVLCFSKM